ncbi:MAG: hypothetical protein KY460_02035 [Actinobacteria bacterium]|nr:hypothetical protein [Actinomycetota bacterium]
MTTRFRLALLVAVVVIAAACTSGASQVVAPTPSDRVSPLPSVPPVATSAPATPRQAALDAYERYLSTTVDAMSEGRADDGQLTAVASDQALEHARRRLRANREDDVVVSGGLVPSATTADVEIDGDGSVATVSDCVLNDLEQVAADDPDRVITERTGWRQPVTATVEQRDGEWIVSNLKVPLRDGSGSVPPPPDDPPFLRGPAQGPAPPSCVPDDLAQQAVAAYEAFREAYDTALGLGRTGPADPDLPALAATAVDPQLSAAREFASELAAEGKAFRGEPSSRDPWAISTLDSDESVFVYDCVTVGANAMVDANLDAPASPNSDAGTYRLDAADVVHRGGKWRVASVSVIEERLNECTSPE